MAAVGLVTILIRTFAAAGVDVIGNGGAAGGDGLGEDGLDGAEKVGEAGAAEAGGEGKGMNAGSEEGFVGIDIAHAAQKALVEQEGLDAGAPGLGEGDKGGFAELERVGTALGVIAGTKDLSELADVVKAQGSVAQMKAGAGEFTLAFIEPQLAGHAEVDEEHTAVEIEDDELAVAAYGLDDAAYSLDGRGAFDAKDGLTGEYRGEAADNGLDFRQLRQFRCRPILPVR